MRKKTVVPTELDTLKLELRQAQDALLNAYHRFDRADAPELIEACIYDIKACSARCDYFYRRIRSEVSGAIPAAKEVGAWV